MMQPITVSGTVSSSQGGTLDGVIVWAISQDSLTTLDTDLTANGGAYTLKVPASELATILIDFIPQEGHAPGFDELLKGNRTQQINKVLKQGPGVSRQIQSAESPVEEPAPSKAPSQAPSQLPRPSPIQKPMPAPDAPEGVSALNLDLKDKLDKLLSFEQIHARLALVPQPDEYDNILRERIVTYLKGMSRPRLQGASGYYSSALYSSVVSKFDYVAALYGVEQVVQTYYCPPQPRRCRIFPLFGRR